MEVIGVGPVGELGEGSMVVVAGEVVPGTLGPQEIVVREELEILFYYLLHYVL